MDAMESSKPSSSDVAASKLQPSDGFARTREEDARGSIGGDDSIFGNRKVSDFGSYGRGIKHMPTILECSSEVRSKKFDADLCTHKNILSSHNCEENGDTHNSAEADRPVVSSPKHESHLLSRKSMKNTSNFPCSKQPRIGQRERSRRNVGAHDVDTILGDTSSDLIGFVCPENSVMGKKRRCHDGMRGEKRNNKASTRCRNFTSKTGFATSDSAYGGNSIPGFDVMKSNLFDFTKHVDELSVNELLNGSYEYPHTCPDKGKKASNVNESILLSVRKACSVLSPHEAAYNNGIQKSSLCLSSPNSCPTIFCDSDDKVKCAEESLPFSKANKAESGLCRPKDVLKNLALPTVVDLDALMEPNTNSFLQSTMKTTPCEASLPPFHWSFSHNGSWRPSMDSGKPASSRNTSRGRWVRVGINSIGNKLELEKDFSSENLINQQKIDDLLQFVKTQNAPIEPAIEGPFGPEAFDSSDIDPASVSRGYVSLRNSESKVGLRCQGNESSSMNSSIVYSHLEGCAVAQREEHADRCNQSPSKPPRPDIFIRGHSPRLLAAAESLYMIASCAKSIERHSSSPEKINGLEEPKTMKAQRPESSMEKTVDGHNDPTMRKPSTERRKGISDESGKSPVRWLVCSDDESPIKFETIRDAENHSRPRNGKHHDEHRKLRRLSPIKASWPGFKGTYIRDRKRSKRV